MPTLTIPLQDLAKTYPPSVIAEIISQSKKTMKTQEGGIKIYHHLIPATKLLAILEPVAGLLPLLTLTENTEQKSKGQKSRPKPHNIIYNYPTQERRRAACKATRDMRRQTIMEAVTEEYRFTRDLYGRYVELAMKKGEYVCSFSNVTIQLAQLAKKEILDTRIYYNKQKHTRVREYRLRTSDDAEI